MSGDEALLSSRLKLLRASECLEATRAEARSSMETAGGGYFEYDPAEPGVLLLVWREIHPLSPMLGVMFGEVVHHLRTALDHLVWQAVVVNGEQPEGSNQFPITDTRGDWLAQVERGRLKGVSPEVEAVIHAAQPYHRGNEAQARDHFLAQIREANNTDKHRTLPVQRQLVSGERFEVPQIFARNGVTPENVVVERLVPMDGRLRLEDNTPLLRIRTIGTTRESHPAAEVGMEPSPILTQVAFEYRTGKVISTGRLRELLESVVALVDEVDDAL